MRDLIGKTLGRYEICEKIGQGGMAQVFKAYQPGLDRFVAVKVLSPTLAEEPGFTARFQREAHSLARLYHPHILEVYDYGAQDDYYYLAMRYVENSRTLGDLIEEGAPLNQLVHYILQVADALNYAHERGIIHRDVKPGNILIDGKRALLTDFGLAKIHQVSSHLTGSGVGIGTPAYMSPEQVSGADSVDHRTDIYALGVILYRILTGTVPHAGPTPLAILAKRCSEPAISPRRIKGDVPESLDSVTLRSLAVDPNLRYGSASQFAEALQRAQQDPTYREESIATPPAGEGQSAAWGEPARAAGSAVAGARTEVRSPARPKAWSLVLAAALLGILVVGVLPLLRPSPGLSRGAAGPAGVPSASQVAATGPAVAPSVPPGDTASPSGPGTPAALAVADLEIRAGPGDAYELLGYLPQGASAEVVGRDQAGDWWQIKTGLNASGLGWIRAGAEFSQTDDTDNLPIALAPPAPTPATATAASLPDTPTPSPTPLSPSPTPTSRPTQAPPSPSPTRAAAPTPTPAAGQFILLKPAPPDQATNGPTTFEWRWTSPLPPNQGFEVRVWREGEAPAGVHNAVEDNQSGKVAALGNNTYRLSADIREAYGVQGRSGDYLWTVALVQISPEYRDLGLQAAPGHLRFEAGGPGGDHGGGQPPIHD